MSEDSNDILYDIGMQLYDEFNDKIATMNDHLGDVYSFRDIEEVEKAEKEKEIKLLRIAIIKQQKEIEEFKKKNENLLDALNNSINIKKYWVNKDKIKEILGIEEETDTEEILSLLQTIVDENARLEDIEDRKVQIEYNNVFNKGVKSVEDKIKAKIEELEIEQESNREDLKIAIDNLLVQNIDKIANKISINMSIRGILQSLLEKEE